MITIILNNEPYDGSDVTWNARCGIYKNEPYFDDSITSTMEILANWVIQSDKVLTF